MSAQGKGDGKGKGKGDGKKGWAFGQTGRETSSSCRRHVAKWVVFVGDMSRNSVFSRGLSEPFGAALFYGSGAVFAEYRSAWKQGQPDIHIYVKEGFSSRCHVFFKRPSKKRSVSIVTPRRPRGSCRVP